MYLSREQAGDVQASEIPISLFMDVGRLAGKDAGDSSERVWHHNAHKEELAAHLRRVAAYAELLARKRGLSGEEALLVKQVCPMHDIGKWMIPAHILQKPSPLNEQEWAIMKTHTLAGYEILKDSKLDILQLGALVAMQHQEKYDGSGYPVGLKGGEIHLYSRITTVVDVFDALDSARTYKEPWPIEAIVDYFSRERGTHFDPELVDLLLEHLDEFLEVRSEFDGGRGGI